MLCKFVGCGFVFRRRVSSIMIVGVGSLSLFEQFNVIDTQNNNVYRHPINKLKQTDLPYIRGMWLETLYWSITTNVIQDTRAVFMSRHK